MQNPPLNAYAVNLKTDMLCASTPNFAGVVLDFAPQFGSKFQ